MNKRFLKASLACLVQAAVWGALPSTASAVPIRFDYTGAFTSYTVQTTGIYQVFAFGAQGGNLGNAAGGLGAEVESDFTLVAGDMVGIAVGGMGGASRSGQGGGGGGGGTFLTLRGSAIIVAGGGGGMGAGGNNNGQAGGQAGMSGADGGNGGSASNLGAGGANGNGGGANAANGGGGGGGGFLSNGGGNSQGGGGGASFSNGLRGGLGDFGGGDGGFGGGGGGGFAGGAAGGGGYSGGGGARQGNGGGGGSYSIGLLNSDRLLLGGVNAGNGYLTLELLPAAVMPAVPEPSSWALMGAGLIGLVAARRKVLSGRATPL